MNQENKKLEKEIEQLKMKLGILEEFKSHSETESNLYREKFLVLQMRYHEIENDLEACTKDKANLQTQVKRMMNM